MILTAKRAILIILAQFVILGIMFLGGVACLQVVHVIRIAFCVVLQVIVVHAKLGTIYPMEVVLHVVETVILVLVIALVLHAHLDII